MKNSFKHSGTSGDLIYSLSLVKYLNGGDFYLHLDQINTLSQMYYGVNPPPIHQNRMNISDYSQLRPLMLAQGYISEFLPLNPQTTEITHNLDRFRTLMKQHPENGNYLKLYADTFNVPVEKLYEQGAWLSVPKLSTTANLPKRVISRTQRWTSQQGLAYYLNNRNKLDTNETSFIGTREEYREFLAATGYSSINYTPTNDYLELAQVINHSQEFYGNQSLAYSLAVGLNHPNINLEIRRDLPHQYNECYFTHINAKNIQYF